MTHKVEITEDVTDRVLSCLDSGFNSIWYWAKLVSVIATESAPTWAEAAIHPKGEIVLREKEFPDEALKPLTREAVLDGLEVMKKHYQRHYMDLINDNSDATTGDVLIQCAIFGKIVFG